MPILLLRLVVGAGLVALAYYVGREVGRLESTRRDLEARKPVATAEPRADRARRLGSALARIVTRCARREPTGARARVASPALPRVLDGTVDRIGMRVGKLDALGTDPAAKTDARVVEVEVRLDDGDAAVAAPLTHLQVEVTIQPVGA
jgi:HAMP domain-containing protein